MSFTHRGKRRTPKRLPAGARLLAAALLLTAGGAGTALAQDAQRARDLAATCANCHGTNGNARGDMRALAGMPADRMLALLADFRAGNLAPTIMHQIVKGYTDEEVKLIAAFFAAQRPAAK